MEEVKQEVESTKEISGKTVISFTEPTPKWATWIFRTEFAINKAVLMILGGTSLLPPEKVKETLIWIAAVDFAIWFMARGLGVKKEDFENN